MTAIIISLADRLAARRAPDVPAAQTAQPRPVPAYCDPSNETRGVKYESTQGLSLTEVAKLIRADIKAAGLARGGFKVSVRTSGAVAIDVRVTAVPPGFRVLSEWYAEWRATTDGRETWPGDAASMDSDDWRALKGALESIRGAYNRDNSDISTDYFDRRYYGTVAMEWQLRERLAARDVEVARDRIEAREAEARAAREDAAAAAARRSPWHQLDMLGAEPECESDMIARENARAAVAALVADGWHADDICIEHALVEGEDRDADDAMDALRWSLSPAAWALIPDTARLVGWRPPMREDAPELRQTAAGNAAL